MKKGYTGDMEIGDEMEDIRQVPLDTGTREKKSSGRPVGSSYMGGAGQASTEPPRRRSRAKGSRGGEDALARPPKMAQDVSSRRSKSAADATNRRSREESVSEKPARGNAASRGGAGKRSISVLAVLLALVLGAGAGLGGGYYLWGWERPYTVDLKAAEVPEWVKQEFIRKNIFSRPDVSRQRVNHIVIHYVANPGSTAQANRNYFDSLADQDPQKSGTSTSSHFVVGLEGEVIQCIPITEIAYGNAPRNNDTIAIEVCHPDETGKFNEATYESVVNLTAWLCNELKLSAKDVVRHYDINGKICPKYFVDHEDAWGQFKKDVTEAMKASI